MNLAAKLKWSIPQGIFLYHANRNKKPRISIGNMQITNKNMIARIFLMILVFSFCRIFISENDDFFQKVFSFLKALNMSEYKTVMIVKGIAIKKTEIIVKLVLDARRLSNAGSKLKKQILIPLTRSVRAM